MIVQHFSIAPKFFRNRRFSAAKFGIVVENFLTG